MKKRYVIEFTVDADDYSDAWIEDQALQELTCMSPFPEDIDFYRKDNPWHTEEPVRMTNRQLAEWLARGFGQYTFGHDDIYTFYTIDIKRENKCVDDAIRIRYWGSDGWIVPTLEIYERDCNGN